MEERHSESKFGRGGACPLLIMYCNDMDCLNTQRTAFRYSVFMSLVGTHVCVRVCVGEREVKMCMETCESVSPKCRRWARHVTVHTAPFYDFCFSLTHGLFLAGDIYIYI